MGDRTIPLNASFDEQLAAAGESLVIAIGRQVNDPTLQCSWERKETEGARLRSVDQVPTHDELN